MIGLATNDIANKVLDAMNIIANGAVQKYKYDQTVEAKVVSTAQKAEGIYKVEYESGIFSAYADLSASYYKNDTVYVMVPQGDWTKQKYIIGRKVDEEKEPSKTFNFRLPFDNFIGLANLSNAEAIDRGWLANHPDHGIIAEDEEKFQQALADYQEGWNEFQLEIQQQRTNLNANYDYFVSALTSIDRVEGSVISSSIVDMMKIAARTICTSTETPVQQALFNINDFETSWRNEFNLLSTMHMALTDVERQQILNAGAQSKALIEANLDKALEEKSAAMSELLSISFNDAESINHIWSWESDEEDGRSLVETKLGIGINVQTLLDVYKPRSGKFGMRILVTGRTYPTEEMPSIMSTSELYFTNDDMYGNTYGFYEPFVQQKIFDISNLMTLKAISIYFWQDHQFFDQFNVSIPWNTGNAELGITPKPNIIFKGLDILLGLTTDECQNDRVFLYTYEDLHYGIDATVMDVEVDDTKILRAAWVHITPDGPILVNKMGDPGSTDMTTLQYWINTPTKIQWYHYEYACAQNSDILEERQGGTNWKYLPEFDNQFEITVMPDNQKAHELYKVVFSYNRIPRSAEITFYNRDITVETASLDAINEVTFKLLRQVPTDTVGEYNIVEDPTLAIMDMYDEHGFAMRNSDGMLVSDVYYYVQVWIRNNESGDYTPMEYDAAAGFSDVTWQQNTGASMIGVLEDVTDEDLSKTVFAPLQENDSLLYKEQLRKITKKFKIKNQLLPEALNNTIAAYVRRNNKIYYPQVTLYFGKQGSMGSDYTVDIMMVEPQGSAMIQNEKFTVVAFVKNRTNETVVSEKFIFSWELLAPTAITKGKNNEWDPNSAWSGDLGLLTEIGDELGYRNNKLTGYIRNEYPPVFKVSVLGVTTTGVIECVRGFRLASTAELSQQYTVNCIDRIEFKSDGSVPLMDTAVFSVREGSAALGTMVFPRWSLAQWRKNGDEWLRCEPPDYFGLIQKPSVSVDLNTNDISLPIWYLNIGSSSEIVPNLDAEFYKQQPEDDAYRAGTYAELSNYIYQYYLADSNSVNNDASLNAASRKRQLDAITETYERRKERLRAVVQITTNGFTGYAIDPYTKSNVETPWIWDNSMKNYYTYVGFGDDSVVPGYMIEDGTLVTKSYNAAYYRQAVPFAQNVYSSTLINSWDGKYYFDDANGLLMSQTISAGTKSNSDNTFTGVLMGNWADYADSTLAIPGLYGILKGQQSFGFRTDGTGFIGSNGHGRIEFDGNKSLISNADKSMYINLDPITYTYNSDGTYNISNYTGYSPYFLYAEAMKSSNGSLIGEDELEQATYWATKFMHDSGKDYFVVDPNNGVLTTGGVIARYGKIGNWMISNQGLYQKYTGTEPDGSDSRYMYLGYTTQASQDAINAINATYQPLYDNVENWYSDAIARANFNMIDYDVDWVAQQQALHPDIFPYDPTHYSNFSWACDIVADILDATMQKWIDADLADDSQNSQAIYAARKLKLDEAVLETLGTQDNPSEQTHSTYHLHYNGTGDTKIYVTSIHAINTLITILGSGYTFYEPNAQEVYNNLLWNAQHPTEEQRPVRRLWYATVKSNLADNHYAFSYPVHFYSEGWDQFLFEKDLTLTANSLGALPVVQQQTLVHEWRRSRWWTPSISAQIYVDGVLQRYTASGSTFAYEDYLPTDFITNGTTIQLANGTTHDPRITTLSDLNVEFIQKLITFLRAVYAYVNDGVERMYKQATELYGGGEVSDNSLEKTELEQQQREQLAAIKVEYKERLAQVKTKHQNAIDNYLNEDKNRYAIWCGYKPAQAGGYPLFSVNWMGSMSAREGLIGYYSPWLINDYGLTQSNNFGTIFLGNPETPYNMQNWVHYGDNLLTYNSTDNTLLFNENNSKLYSLKNETNNSHSARGPKVYGEYGKFAIAAGNLPVTNLGITTLDRQVHFGVRMDGTLFSDRGLIGNWRITDTELVSYKNDDPTKTEYINLDAGQKQIRLFDSQIVMDGTSGILFIGARKQNATQGELYLASHHFKGRSGDGVTYHTPMTNDGVTTIPAAGALAYTPPAGSQEEAQSGNYIAGNTWTVHKKIVNETPSTAINLTGNILSITETINDKVSGAVLSNLWNDNLSVLPYWYPQINGGWLGTQKKRWNMYGDTIYGNFFYQNGCLVATEEYVSDLITWCSNNIVAVDTAAKKAWDRAQRAIGACIDQVYLVGGGGAGTSTVTLIATRYNGGFIRSDLDTELASAEHSHPLTVHVSGGKVEVALDPSCTSGQSKDDASLNFSVPTITLGANGSGSGVFSLAGQDYVLEIDGGSAFEAGWANSTMEFSNGIITITSGGGNYVKTFDISSAIEDYVLGGIDVACSAYVSVVATATASCKTTTPNGSVIYTNNTSKSVRGTATAKANATAECYPQAVVTYNGRVVGTWATPRAVTASAIQDSDTATDSSSITARIRTTTSGGGSGGGTSAET